MNKMLPIFLAIFASTHVLAGGSIARPVDGIFRDSYEDYPPGNEFNTLEVEGQGGFVKIGADSLPVIVYVGKATGGAALKVAKCNDASCSGGDELISVVDTHGWGEPSMEIGEDGFPIIAYYDFTDKTLKVAKCNDVACQGQDESISFVDSWGLHPSVAIGGDGFPIIAYRDYDTSNLKIAKCNDIGCIGGNEQITTIDDSGDVANPIHLKIGSDGFPVISYNYLIRGAGALLIAKCNDSECFGSDESVTVVESTGDAVIHSMVLDRNDFPVISYRYNDKDLHLIRCNDAACAGSNETYTVLVSSPENNRTGWDALAIGQDGFPIISFNNHTGVPGSETTRNHVIKCGDDVCSPEKAVNNEVFDSYGEPSMVIGNFGLPLIVFGSTVNPNNGLEGVTVVHCGSPACY